MPVMEVIIKTISIACIELLSNSEYSLFLSLGGLKNQAECWLAWGKN